MRNKILIFVFTILTFGLFLVPLSFAKDSTGYEFNKINRIYNITCNDSNNTITFDINIGDLNLNSRYWYISLTLFDNDGNNWNVLDSSNCVLWYKTGANSGDLNYRNLQSSGQTYEQFYRDCFVPSVSAKYAFITLQLTSVNYVSFRDSYQYANVLCYDGALDTYYTPFSYQFIPNDYYGVNYNTDYGVFNGCKVYLGLSGSQTMSDVSDTMINYNLIRFNSLSNNVASNNDRDTNQYYLRIYFNRYVKDMVNYNISYAELSYISINNSYYSYSDARNVLPILDSNIVLYNSSSKLFTIDTLDTSGYGGYYIEYIDFRVADYTFKSSQYYNSNIGILGYIDGFSISADNYTASQYYNDGYNDGIKNGYDSGYNNGYNDGVASNTTSFDGLMLSVANVPMTIISSMLNFEVLGVNLLSFFMGIITLVLFVHLMRKFKE